MTHPYCEHVCSGNCRREGCNCLCGEFHDSMTKEELKEAIADGFRDMRIELVKRMMRMYVQGNSAYLLASNIVDALFDEPK